MLRLSQQARKQLLMTGFATQNNNTSQQGYMPSILNYCSTAERTIGTRDVIIDLVILVMIDANTAYLCSSNSSSF
jgi:hypothetical protein